MVVYNREFKVTSPNRVKSPMDITETVKDAVATSGIQSGIVTIVTAHDLPPFSMRNTHDVDRHGWWLHLDLNDALEKILPPHTSAQTYRYPGPLHYAEVESHCPDVDDWLPGGDRSLLWKWRCPSQQPSLAPARPFAVVDGQ